MPSIPHDRLKDLYQGYYRNIFKPLLAEVEVSFQELPAPILNEIRAFNDHISRLYVDDVNQEAIDENLLKAKSHMIRAILDCFKYMNVYYYERIERLERKYNNCDWTSIDNGKFHVEYMEKSKQCHKSLQEAKKNEIRDFENGTFDLYQKAYVQYSELHDFLIMNLHNLQWAKVKFKVTKWFPWAVMTLVLAFFTIAGGWGQTAAWFQAVYTKISTPQSSVTTSESQSNALNK